MSVRKSNIYEDLLCAWHGAFTYSSHLFLIRALWGGYFYPNLQGKRSELRLCIATEMRKWKPWVVSQRDLNPPAGMNSLVLSAAAWAEAITQKLLSLRCKPSQALHIQTILGFLSPDSVFDGSPRNQTSTLPAHQDSQPTEKRPNTFPLPSQRFPPPWGHCFKDSNSLHSSTAQVPHSWEEGSRISHTVLLLPDRCSGIETHSFVLQPIRPYQPPSLSSAPHWPPIYSAALLNFAPQSSSP